MDQGTAHRMRYGFGGQGHWIAKDLTKKTKGPRRAWKAPELRGRQRCRLHALDRTRNECQGRASDNWTPYHGNSQTGPLNAR
jgi:hypothetical protein